ncbi:MAG: hypothetical protein JST12_04845 [Armatimonadetes bacterium]|nr:hypothetical protein [Armatimonadota bacterium]
MKKTFALLMGIGVGVGVLAWMIRQKEEEESSENLLNQMNEKIEHLEARTKELQQNA